MSIAASAKWIFGAWASAAVLMGAVRSAQNQPTPHQENGDKVLHLVKNTHGSEWRAVHVIAASEAASVKEMASLIARRPHAGYAEEIFVVDGTSPAQEGSEQMLAKLQDEGFRVNHIAAEEVEQNVGLHGAPMFVVDSPTEGVVYASSEGSNAPDESAILQKFRAS